jgi:hypothetical protein
MRVFVTLTVDFRVERRVCVQFKETTLGVGVTLNNDVRKTVNLTVVLLDFVITKVRVITHGVVFWVVLANARLVVVGHLLQMGTQNIPIV